MFIFFFSLPSTPFVFALEVKLHLYEFRSIFVGNLPFVAKGMHRMHITAACRTEMPVAGRQWAVRLLRAHELWLRAAMQAM